MNSQHHTNPSAWASAVQPLRACALCTHGTTHPVTHERLCRCPVVVGARLPQPVDAMRSVHGACGPDATHLDFPGLHP